MGVTHALSPELLTLEQVASSFMEKDRTDDSPRLLDRLGEDAPANQKVVRGCSL